MANKGGERKRDAWSFILGNADFVTDEIIQAGSKRFFGEHEFTELVDTLFQVLDNSPSTSKEGRSDDEWRDFFSTLPFELAAVVKARILAALASEVVIAYYSLMSAVATAGGEVGAEDALVAGVAQKGAEMLADLKEQVDAELWSPLPMTEDALSEVRTQVKGYLVVGAEARLPSLARD